MCNWAIYWQNWFLHQPHSDMTIVVSFTSIKTQVQNLSKQNLSSCLPTCFHDQYSLPPNLAGCLVRAQKVILGKWNVLNRTLLPNLKMGSWKNRSMFQSVSLTYLTIQLSNKLIPLGPILWIMIHQRVGVKKS